MTRGATVSLRTAVGVTWLLALFLLALLVSGGGDAPARSADAAVVSPTTTAHVPVTAATTTTAAAVPQWVEVTRLSGNSEKQGDTFSLSGRARLRYESKALIFAVYVMEEGTTLTEDGGFPEVSCPAACSDETNLRQTGDFYLAVKASGGDWSVVIEALR